MPQRLRDLKLDEISVVDDPASPGAEVVLQKRKGNGPVAKGDDDKPLDLNAALAEAEAREKRWKVMDGFWKLFDAFRSSLNSIIEHAEPAEKGGLITTTIEQFTTKVEEMAPEIAVLKGGSAAAVSNPQEDDMDIEKLAADLEAAEARIVEVTKRNDDLEAENAVLKAGCADCATMKACKASGKCAKSGKPLADMAKVARGGQGGDQPAEDDVIKGLPENVRKMIEDGRKAQDDLRIAKAAESAEKEFPHMPGSTVEKGRVYLALQAIPEADRATLTKMLKAGDAALGMGFNPVGKAGEAEGDKGESPIVKRARAEAEAASGKAAK